MSRRGTATNTALTSLSALSKPQVQKNQKSKLKGQINRGCEGKGVGKKEEHIYEEGSLTNQTLSFLSYLL